MNVLDNIHLVLTGETTRSNQPLLARLVGEIHTALKRTPHHEQGVHCKKIADLLKAQGSAYVAEFTVYCYSLTTTGADYPLRWTCGDVLAVLHKSNVLRTETEFTGVLMEASAAIKASSSIHNLSVFLVIKQVERFAARRSLSPGFEQFLGTLVDSLDLIPAGRYERKEVDRIKSTVAKLIHPATDANRFPAVRLDEQDAFGGWVNQTVNDAQSIPQTILYGLLAHFKKATGARPSAKFQQEAKKLYEKSGDGTQYANLAKTWLQALSQVTVQSQLHTVAYGGGRDTYTSYSFIGEINAIIAKGFVWSLVGLPDNDDELLKSLAKAAETCYQKIPGQGAAASGVGNACLYVLAQSGLPGVAQLSRMKMRVKQANTQELIGKYIQEAAEKLTVSPAEIEDMAVADYGLADGTFVQEFGDYRAAVVINSVGKAEIRWSTVAGTSLKSEPVAGRKAYAAALKILKATVADVARNLTAQRDRLDRSLVLDRQWSWQAFTDYYAEHGLMQVLARRLIWIVEQAGQLTEVFWRQGQWATVAGEEIPECHPDRTVRLWHPVGKSLENVLAWRDFLTEHEIRQPIKQAFREVYLLTDAELNTRVYSNRMAAHILKQHQFNTLAKGRGWRYSLLGAYDKGYESDKAQINLPAYDLRAEFWVNEVAADDAWNDTGIYLYVSTDQVRFTRLAGTDPLNLIDIPPVVFSEIMRDVDLFVGVGSVGNDPNWRDGGLTQFRTYWESYSFGQLSELAKTRKQALERLIPRLTIGRVAEIHDKFLVVRGKLRTYNIHIGSGNILMEPNNQYLCIVADRSADTTTQGVFLPFEGDAVLSIILSKALLLADDDKITDTTITRQIRS